MRIDKACICLWIQAFVLLGREVLPEARSHIFYLTAATTELANTKTWQERRGMCSKSSKSSETITKTFTKENMQVRELF